MSNDARVDSITQFNGEMKGSGTVAQKLLASNFNINSLRTQDILRLREWISFDETVIMVARQRLVAVNDLVQAGLTYNVPNALGIFRVEWERFSDLGGAEVGMSGITLGANDKFEIDLQGIPLPIVHKDFSLNIRLLTAGRNAGTPIDTTQAALNTRIVAEKIEAILFAGTTVGSANNTVYGYTNYTDRITGSVTTAAWSTQAISTTTAYTIITDVLAMIGAAAAKNFYGPFMLYVSVADYIAMGNDFKANSGLTILQRIKMIPGIIDIKPSSNLTGTAVVLVQMTPDVIDMVDGIQPTMVMWESHGGMIANFKIMAIMVPRCKSDQTAQCGIVHYS